MIRNTPRRRLLSALVTLGLTTLVACGGGQGKQTADPTHLDARTRARQAESYLTAGRISDALDAADEAIAEEPGEARWQHLRGSILFRAGRFPEALPAFEKALALDPYLTDAHNFIGSIYTEQRKWTEAEAQFRKALSDPAYPTPELVYLNMAVLFAAQGRDEDAVAELRKSVQLNPQFYQAHFELASTLDRLGKYPEAASEYEVASPQYRQSGDFYYRLGLVYFRLGDAVKARQNLRRAIDVSPGSESAAKSEELLQMIR